MRDSIIAIVLLPFILIAIAGFYILIGIFIISAYIYNGILWLFPYERFSDIEKRNWKEIFRLNGIEIKRKK